MYICHCYSLILRQFWLWCDSRLLPVNSLKYKQYCFTNKWFWDLVFSYLSYIYIYIYFFFFSVFWGGGLGGLTLWLFRHKHLQIRSQLALSLGRVSLTVGAFQLALENLRCVSIRKGRRAGRRSSLCLGSNTPLLRGHRGSVPARAGQRKEPQTWSWQI